MTRGIEAVVAGDAGPVVLLLLGPFHVRHAPALQVRRRRQRGPADTSAPPAGVSVPRLTVCPVRGLGGVSSRLSPTGAGRGRRGAGFRDGAGPRSAAEVLKESV